MHNERDRLICELHNLSLSLRDLKDIFQNGVYIGNELIDMLIDQLENRFFGIDISLKVLKEETIEYLKNLKR